MNFALFFRHYFALQTNPGEQFYLFTSLAAWLIRKTGRPFEQPQEYDDPNSTISSILDSLRQLVSVYLIQKCLSFVLNIFLYMLDRSIGYRKYYNAV